MNENFTINHKKNVIEVYRDPRSVLRLKKDRKETKEIIIELHNSIIGRMSMKIPPELLKELIDELSKK